MASGVSSSSTGPKKTPSAVENIHKAVRCKEDGNRSFAEGDLRTAMKNWHEGILYVAGINSFASMYGARSTPAQNEKAQELTNAFRSNLAACYIKQEQWEKAIYATSKVLEVDPRNLKARYRRSLSYLRLKDTQKAASDLDHALEQAPNDASVRRLAMELVEQEEDRVARMKEEEARKVEAAEHEKRQEEEAKRNVR
ncbi:hypothetical protein CBS101457_006566 [Exobasidium rhododendri]|nr:hypothetical protein CBS101457_006566 [Exobasidium rhododendri]